MQKCVPPGGGADPKLSAEVNSALKRNVCGEVGRCLHTATPAHLTARLLRQLAACLAACPGCLPGGLQSSFAHRLAQLPFAACRAAPWCDAPAPACQHRIRRLTAGAPLRRQLHCRQKKAGRAGGGSSDKAGSNGIIACGLTAPPPSRPPLRCRRRRPRRAVWGALPWGALPWGALPWGAVCLWVPPLRSLPAVDTAVCCGQSQSRFSKILLVLGNMDCYNPDTMAPKHPGL